MQNTQSTLRQDIYKYLLMIVCVCIIVYVLPKGRKFKYEFDKGKPWMHEKLVAPFDFAIEKSTAELENEKQEIIEQIPSYYERNHDIEDISINTLRTELN
ncbi:MAG: hypothetical protein ACK45U_03475, partial [bacterium]